MMRGLYNGVSGIKTQSFGMDVWANNISNINNVGFKASTPEYKSILYQIMYSAGNKPTTDQVGLGAVKQATALDMSNGSYQNTDNNFDVAIQGDGFFGVLDRYGKTYYTRAGNFDIDAAGNLVDTFGNFVLGTINELSAVTPSQSALNTFSGSGQSAQNAYTISKIDSLNLGSESAQSAIKLPSFLYLASEPTTLVNFRGNLDSTVKTQIEKSELSKDTYTQSVDEDVKTISISGALELSNSRTGYKKNDSVTVKIADASGKFSEFTTQLDKNGKWSLENQDIKYLDLDTISTEVSIFSSKEVANTQQFSTQAYGENGAINLITINLEKQVPQASNQTLWNATATMTDKNGNVLNSSQGIMTFGPQGTLVSNTLTSVGGVKLNFLGSGDPSVYDGLISTANSDKNISITKNGYEEGVLKRYQMNDNGDILAIFDNTRMFPVAKLALYHFQNDQGLAKMGDNIYSATANSGEAFFYKDKAGDVIYGSRISSNMLEMSNVDLGSALTEIIVTQKAYDASSKSITTSDEMLQTAIQMKS
ncbi:flagellar hook-basal body complex protein [Campylobacter sp. RM9328]|uniref:flagellar hook protein FlgE n=1 Tax=Campylobacter sp. RM9328 TaxID=1705720 RepID=UPI0014752B55|nr:flagellar hook-basal body complex protein [Campylobacter sp. RM9328]